MSNILTVTKLVTNHPKMTQSFKDDPTCSPTFDFVYIKGDKVQVYFTENMTQAVADAGTLLIQNHVDTDVLSQETDMTKQKQEAGFQLYQKIIADININGGLGGLLDDDQIPAYENYLRVLRDMLKDGFPEFALRKYVTDISPLNLFPQAQQDQYIAWIAQLALDYGADPALVGALQVVPKGVQPFGAIAP